MEKEETTASEVSQMEERERLEGRRKGVKGEREERTEVDPCWQTNFCLSVLTVKRQ